MRGRRQKESSTIRCKFGSPAADGAISEFCKVTVQHRLVDCLRRLPPSEAVHLDLKVADIRFCVQSPFQAVRSNFAFARIRLQE